VPLFLEDNNNPAEMLFKEVLAAKQEQPKANQQQLQHDNIDWFSIKHTVYFVGKQWHVADDKIY
jgi:hypothetical protein